MRKAGKNEGDRDILVYVVVVYDNVVVYENVVHDVVDYDVVVFVRGVWYIIWDVHLFLKDRWRRG
jgi:hypothetical protein